MHNTPVSIILVAVQEISSKPTPSTSTATANTSTGERKKLKSKMIPKNIFIYILNKGKNLYATILLRIAVNPAAINAMAIPIIV